MLRHWSQFVPNMPADIREHEALHHHQHLNCSAQQLKQQLRSTLFASQWRGPHCLNIVVILPLVHVLLGLQGRSAYSLCLYPPPPLRAFLSPSLISHLASVDVKQHVYLLNPQSELRSCVKVEVGVLTVLIVCVHVKQ